MYTVHLFLMLLSLAAKSNRDGALMLTDDIPYDEPIIASLVPLDSKQVQPALQLLTRYGLIAQQDASTACRISPNGWSFSNRGAQAAEPR